MISWRLLYAAAICALALRLAGTVGVIVKDGENAAPNSGHFPSVVNGSLSARPQSFDVR